MFLGELVSLNQWSPPLPLRALTQWEGRTFSSVKVKRIRAMYPRKEAISLPLPVFGSISALRARNIIPSAISLLGSIHMWPCDGSSSVGRRIYSPHASDPIIPYPFSNKSPELVRAFESWIIPCALNCIPLPKIFQSRLSRNGCATFEFLNSENRLSLFFFFRWRNKKKINNEKNRYLDKEKFLLGILKGEGWLFYTCCNFNFKGGWRFDPK